MKATMKISDFGSASQKTVINLVTANKELPNTLNIRVSVGPYGVSYLTYSSSSFTVTKLKNGSFNLVPKNEAGMFGQHAVVTDPVNSGKSFVSVIIEQGDESIGVTPILTEISRETVAYMKAYKKGAGFDFNPRYSTAAVNLMYDPSSGKFWNKQVSGKAPLLGLCPGKIQVFDGTWNYKGVKIVDYNNRKEIDRTATRALAAVKGAGWLRYIGGMLLNSYGIDTKEYYLKSIRETNKGRFDKLVSLQDQYDKSSEMEEFIGDVHLLLIAISAQSERKYDNIGRAVPGSYPSWYNKLFPLRFKSVMFKKLMAEQRYTCDITLSPDMSDFVDINGAMVPATGPVHLSEAAVTVAEGRLSIFDENFGKYATVDDWLDAVLLHKSMPEIGRATTSISPYLAAAALYLDQNWMGLDKDVAGDVIPRGLSNSNMCRYPEIFDEIVKSGGDPWKEFLSLSERRINGVKYSGDTVQIVRDFCLSYNLTDLYQIAHREFVGDKPTAFDELKRQFTGAVYVETDIPLPQGARTEDLFFYAPWYSDKIKGSSAGANRYITDLAPQSIGLRVEVPTITPVSAFFSSGTPYTMNIKTLTSVSSSEKPGLILDPTFWNNVINLGDNMASPYLIAVGKVKGVSTYLGNIGFETSQSSSKGDSITGYKGIPEVLPFDAHVVKQIKNVSDVTDIELRVVDATYPGKMPVYPRPAVYRQYNRFLKTV